MQEIESNWIIIHFAIGYRNINIEKTAIREKRRCTTEVELMVVYFDRVDFYIHNTKHGLKVK